MNCWPGVVESTPEFKWQAGNDWKVFLKKIIYLKQIVSGKPLFS